MSYSVLDVLIPTAYIPLRMHVNKLLCRSIFPCCIYVYIVLLLLYVLLCAINIVIIIMFARYKYVLEYDCK